MNIQTTQEKELYDILNNQSNQGYEMEFRFGKFTNKSFSPGISYETYLRLDKFLRKFCSIKPVEFTSHDVYDNKRLVKYFQPISEEQCFSDFPDEQTWKMVYQVCTLKKQIKKIDIKDYGIRFSLASEEETEWNEEDVIPSNVFKKLQKRIVYVWGKIEFHLSKIYNKDLDQISYEIEIELPVLNNKTFKNFMEFLSNTFMMCYQHTNKVMKDRTYKDILKDYQILVGSKKFIGSKAESLRYNKINFNTEYAVSDKLDGERKLLYFRKSRIIVLNYNNFLWVLNKEPLKEEFVTKYENTVLDAEYYDGKFYIFDILRYNGNKVEENLKERINIYTELIQELQMENVLPKPYFFSENLYENVLTRLNDQKNIKTDGIIMTPVDKGIILKFKDGEPNTVDFKIKKKGLVNGRELWWLYCYDKDKEILYSNENYNIKPELYVAQEISKYFQDDTVVEFKYNKEINTFIPLRERIDKKKGNFIQVVNDNIYLDLYPFRIQWLKNPNMDEYSVATYNVSRFKNFFMRTVIKDFKNKGNLLMYSYKSPDDVYKIIDNNIRNTAIIAKDSDKTKLASKCEKISTDKTTKNFNFNTYDSLSEIDEDFTMIFSFEENIVYTDKIIKDLKKKLKKNGVVIIRVFNKQSECVVNSDLFTYTKDQLICKNYKSKVILQDTETLFKNNNMKLVETISYRMYYEKWRYNNNFLNEQEHKFVGLHNYLVFKL